jgi:transcriptional regulator with XRE-family HTH domain
MGPTTVEYVERLAGNLLRIARSRAGMSQRQLAKAAGVPQSTIARIESGARQPSLPVLARILAAVDLQPRITLEAYDPHDDVLDATDARLNNAQRAARRAAQDKFAAQLRTGS